MNVKPCSSCISIPDEWPGKFTHEFHEIRYNNQDELLFPNYSFFVQQHTRKKTLFIYDNNYAALGLRHMIATIDNIHLRMCKFDKESVIIDEDFKPDIFVWMISSPESTNKMLSEVISLRTTLKKSQHFVITNKVPNEFTGYNKVVHGISFENERNSLQQINETLKHIYHKNTKNLLFWSGVTLTKKQFTLLTLLAKDCKAEDIAAHFSISTNTVNAHKFQIYKKLKMHSKVDIAWMLRIINILIKSRPVFEKLLTFSP